MFCLVLLDGSVTCANTLHNVPDDAATRTMESSSPATTAPTTNGTYRLERLEESVGAEGTAAATTAAATAATTTTTATRGQPDTQEYLEPPSVQHESNFWWRDYAVRESTATGTECKLSCLSIIKHGNQWTI